jgi:hypothetical protein
MTLIVFVLSAVQLNTGGRHSCQLEFNGVVSSVKLTIQPNFYNDLISFYIYF